MSLPAELRASGPVLVEKDIGLAFGLSRPFSLLDDVQVEFRSIRLTLVVR